jgi:hypothetical protein
VKQLDEVLAADFFENQRSAHVDSFFRRAD